MNSLSFTIKALYEAGVLKPTQPISLAGGTHVSLVITTAPKNPLGQSPAAILAAIAALPLEADNQTFSNRDHDAVLYSTEGEA